MLLVRAITNYVTNADNNQKPWVSGTSDHRYTLARTDRDDYGMELATRLAEHAYDTHRNQMMDEVVVHDQRWQVDVSNRIATTEQASAS